MSYFSNGRRLFRSLKTRDEKLARFLQKELEVNLAKGLYLDSRTQSVDQFFQEYLRRITHRKSTTNRNEIYTIQDFIRHANKKTINKISPDDLWSFMQPYEGKSPETFNRVLGAVRRFLKVAVEKGYLVKNPADDLHRRKTPQSLPHFFADDEYSRIEQVSEGHPLYPMIVTARYTGMRLRELIHLEWQDFDWEKKLVKVLNKPQFGHTVKNYQARVVPVCDELRDKLLPYIKKDGLCFTVIYGKQKGEKYADTGPREALKSIFKKAGINTHKRIGWHEFRHTFASRLVQNNVPLYKISKWLGHASLAVTQVYAHFAPVYDEDIEKLSINHHASFGASLPIGRSSVAL